MKIALFCETDKILRDPQKTNTLNKLPETIKLFSLDHFESFEGEVHFKIILLPPKVDHKLDIVQLIKNMGPDTLIINEAIHHDKLNSIISALFEQNNNNDILFFKNLKLNHTIYRLESGSENFELTPIETKFLKILFTHPNTIHSHESLKEKIWGNRSISKNNLATHVNKMKKEIMPLKNILMNKRGKGYYLK